MAETPFVLMILLSHDNKFQLFRDCVFCDTYTVAPSQSSIRCLFKEPWQLNHLLGDAVNGTNTNSGWTFCDGETCFMTCLLHNLLRSEIYNFISFVWLQLLQLHSAWRLSQRLWSAINMGIPSYWVYCRSFTCRACLQVAMNTFLPTMNYGCRSCCPLPIPIRVLCSCYLYLKYEVGNTISSIWSYGRSMFSLAWRSWLLPGCGLMGWAGISEAPDVASYWLATIPSYFTKRT